MLKIYLNADEVTEDIVDDVEKEFRYLTIEKNDVICKILDRIEGATYCDTAHFIDRFGCKLPISELSTGCKAAICAALIPDKCIDTKECGLSARDAIITTLKSGIILIHLIDITISSNFGHSLCSTCNGHSFSDLKDLNSYIQDIYPLY